MGDFAVLVASKMNVEDNQAPLTPAAAVDYLRKHGLKVSSDLAAPLTEKDASDLFAQLGVALQTEHPANPLTPDRATTLIGIFGSNLTSTNSRIEASMSTTSAALPAPTLDTTPADCQALPRPPGPCTGSQAVCNPCMDCCKNQLGLSGKQCGPLCQKKNLAVSPTEPTP